VHTRNVSLLVLPAVRIIHQIETGDAAIGPSAAGWIRMIMEQYLNNIRDRINYSVEQLTVRLP
jgi:hypothetical protein